MRDKQKKSFKKSGLLERMKLGDLKIQEMEHSHFAGQNVEEKFSQVEEESELPRELYKLLYNTTALLDQHKSVIEGLCAWEGYPLPVPPAQTPKKKRRGRGRPPKKRTAEKLGERLASSSLLPLEKEEGWEGRVVDFYDRCWKVFMQLRTETLTVLCDLVGICLCFAPRVNKNGVASKARRRGVRTSDSREARARHLACMFTLPDSAFMNISPGE
ncbi:hypothetical protein AAMO2058_000712100 [Amorphochlora amoebiformis]